VLVAQLKNEIIELKIWKIKIAEYQSNIKLIVAQNLDSFARLQLRNKQSKQA